MPHFIKCFTNWNKFDDLKYIFYTNKNKPLPPTFNMSHGHILRSHYVHLTFSNLISTSDTNLHPVEFGWNSVDSVLMPNKCIVTLPEMCTITCACKKKCTGRCHCSKLRASCIEFWKHIWEEYCAKVYQQTQMNTV